jgi:hypothetical protein
LALSDIKVVIIGQVRERERGVWRERSKRLSSSNPPNRILITDQDKRMAFGKIKHKTLFTHMMET